MVEAPPNRVLGLVQQRNDFFALGAGAGPIA